MPSLLRHTPRPAMPLTTSRSSALRPFSPYRHLRNRFSTSACPRLTDLAALLSSGRENQYPQSSSRPAPAEDPAVRHCETTVLVSRGVPGLGGSDSSTCLDFRPHRGGVNVDVASLSSSSTSSSSSRYSYSAASPVRCTTGLTSGALRIHSLHNLYKDVSGGDGGAQSSTVEYYVPRQQRLATSVAWCPAGGSGGNLIAVGLYGSGGSPGGEAVGVGAGGAGQHQHLQQQQQHIALALPRQKSSLPLLLSSLSSSSSSLPPSRRSVEAPLMATLTSTLMPSTMRKSGSGKVGRRGGEEVLLFYDAIVWPWPTVKLEIFAHF
jgi:hypothetical protein